MRVLTIGNDPGILNPTSVSADRMRLYGSRLKRLGIITLGLKHEKDVHLSKDVVVFAARTTHRILFVPAVLFSLRRVARDGRWDVVSAQDPFESGLAALVAASYLGTHLHLQVHGDFFGSNAWRSSRLLNWFRYWLGLFLLKRAERVRVVSKRIQSSLISLGVAENKIDIAPILSYPGIDKLQTIKPNQADSQKIIFVGRFEKEKNPLLLIDAFADIHPRFPDISLEFIGCGTLQLEMEKMIDKRSLGDVIKILPWKDDLIDIYRSATLLVITSNHEGWGRVVIEAGLAGVPVVMSDVGCAGEFVRDGENGWVFTVGDRKQLVRALSLALNDPQERRLRAERLHKDVEVFLKRDGVSDILRSWEQVLKLP